MWVKKMKMKKENFIEEVRRKTASSLALNYCDTGEIDTYEKAVTALEALVQWEEAKSICKTVVSDES